jgi:predicted NAD-dependent protein-ADP-ribosyltransferase YbiA (DUF1768 family)
MKPHQRKKTAGGEASTSHNTDNPNLPVFFYTPREHPYGLSCQWKSGDFTVSVSSLSWLRLAHPASSNENLSSDDETGTLKFNCAEQWMMYCKAAFFSDQISAAKIMESEDPAEQKKMGRT